MLGLLQLQRAPAGSTHGKWRSSHVKFLWFLFVIFAGFVVIAVLLPLAHLVLAVAVIVAAAVFLMAVWKAMFGPRNAGSPPRLLP